MPFTPWTGNVSVAGTLTTTGTVSVGSDLNVSGHMAYLAPTPGAAAGGNAGTGPPAPVVPTGSNDGSGIITFGTGTLPAAGVLVVVTFGKAWTVPGGGAPHVVVSPQNSATQALGVFPSGISPTGFNLSSASAPAASQGNTVYSFAYHVFG